MLLSLVSTYVFSCSFYLNFVFFLLSCIFISSLCLSFTLKRLFLPFISFHPVGFYFSLSSLLYSPNFCVFSLIYRVFISFLCLFSLHALITSFFLLPSPSLFFPLIILFCCRHNHHHYLLTSILFPHFIISPLRLIPASLHYPLLLFPSLFSSLFTP